MYKVSTPQLQSFNSSMQTATYDQDTCLHDYHNPLSYSDSMLPTGVNFGNLSTDGVASMYKHLETYQDDPAAKALIDERNRLEQSLTAGTKKIEHFKDLNDRVKKYLREKRSLRTVIGNIAKTNKDLERFLESDTVQGYKPRAWNRHVLDFCKKHQIPLPEKPHKKEGQQRHKKGKLEHFLVSEKKDKNGHFVLTVKRKNETSPNNHAFTVTEKQAKRSNHHYVIVVDAHHKHHHTEHHRPGK